MTLHVCYLLFLKIPAFHFPNESKQQVWTLVDSTESLENAATVPDSIFVIDSL